MHKTIYKPIFDIQRLWYQRALTTFFIKKKKKRYESYLMHNVKKDLKIKNGHKNYNIFKECSEIYTNV